MYAFNKAITFMAVATEFFCYSYCSLGQVEWYSLKITTELVEVDPFARHTPSSSQNKRILCIKSITVWNFYQLLTGQGLSQSFPQMYHFVQNHVPHNKNLVSWAYTKVCWGCGRFYTLMWFARKAKITPWNSNTGNC